MADLIIFGAGLSGLTAGIMARKANIETLIIEKNNFAGGLCTAYKKDGALIDMCIHWLTDCKDSKITNLYKEVGLYNEDNILNLDYFYNFYYENEFIKISKDLEKFSSNLVKYAKTKKDMKLINILIKDIKKLSNLPIFIDYPMEIMKHTKLLKTGLGFIPFIKSYSRYSHITIYDYANKYDSNILKEFFISFMPSNFSAVYFVGLLAKFIASKADILNINSGEASNNLLNKYLDLGGKIIYNEEIIKLNIENNNIKSINTKNNEYKAKYYINTISLPFFYKNILDEKYVDNKIFIKLIDFKRNPILSAAILVFKVDKKYEKELEHYFIINVKEGYKLNSSINYSVGFRAYPYFENDDNSTTLVAIIDQNGNDYEYWNNLNEDEYNNIKNKLNDDMINILDKYLNIKSYISLIDFITPKSFNKLFNAYNGSYLSNVCTDNSNRKTFKYRDKLINNLYYGGQFQSTIGGIPCAIANGDLAVKRLLHDIRRSK